MSDVTTTTRRRLRFSMKAMLALVFVLALVLWGGMFAYERYNSIALADAVNAFNIRAQNDAVGKHERPLTEKEVLAAINAQLPTLGASPRIKAIYRKIAHSRRLPLKASFDEINAYSASSDSSSKTVWWINLKVMVDSSNGYAMRIRETNDPVAVTIDRMDVSELTQSVSQ